MIAPLRSDTRANWLAANPVLAVNEAVVESDTGQVRVGNGVDGFAFLPTAGITADAAARLYPNPLIALDSQVAALITASGEATPAALGAAFVPKWAANTAYASGDKVLNPSGQVVSANSAFTSGTSYTAANWTVVSGGGASLPTQTGNAGKYLTTDGSTASWGTVSAGATISSAGNWATSTAYTPGQVVVQSGVRYECAVAHTSGVFNTDLSAGKWVQTGVDSGAALSLPADAAGWLHDDGSGILTWSTPTTADTGGVAKAGDTMTGPLTLQGNPVSNLQAATKQYVDNAAAAGQPRPVGFPLFMAPTATSGRVESLGGFSGNVSSTLTADGTGFIVPFYVERGATFTLGLKCTTAGSTGALARIGVWNSANGYPGTLLADCGTITATAVDGVVPAQYTTTSVTLTAGVRYWVGVALQGAPTTAPVFASIAQPSWTVLATSNGEGFAFKMTGMTGAFADNPVGTTLSTMVIQGQGTNMPRVFFKEA